MPNARNWIPHCHQEQCTDHSGHGFHSSFTYFIQSWWFCLPSAGQEIIPFLVTDLLCRRWPHKMVVQGRLFLQSLSSVSGRCHERHPRNTWILKSSPCLQEAEVEQGSVNYSCNCSLWGASFVFGLLCKVIQFCWGQMVLAEVLRKTSMALSLEGWHRLSICQPQRGIQGDHKGLVENTRHLGWGSWQRWKIAAVV